MPIVSTEIVSQGRFSDGIHLSVKFTDHNGDVLMYHRKVPHGTNLNEFIAMKKAKKEEGLLRDDLYKAVYKKDKDYQLKHANHNQLVEFVAKEYQESVIPEQKANVSKRLDEWIDSGRIKDNELRTAFNVKQAELNTLKQKIKERSLSKDKLDKVRDD